jgi:hypothetical protein
MEFIKLLTIKLMGGTAKAAAIFTDPTGEPAKTMDTVTTLVNRLQGIASSLAGMLAFAVIIWGAALYITAGGEPEKVKTARKILTYGVGGVLLILFANVLIRIFIILLGGTA